MDDPQLELEMDNLRKRPLATDLEQEKISIDPIAVEDVLVWGKNCLLVKLLSTKYYNREAFKVTMNRVWRPSKTLKFVEMGEEMSMAEFGSLQDEQRVLHNSPWNFDKCLVLVKNSEGINR